MKPNYSHLAQKAQIAKENIDVMKASLIYFKAILSGNDITDDQRNEYNELLIEGNKRLEAMETDILNHLKAKFNYY